MGLASSVTKSIVASKPSTAELFSYINAIPPENLNNLIKTMFDNEDTDKTGMLDRDETARFFRAAYQHLESKGVSVSKTETEAVSEWLKEYDLDADGKLSWKEFQDSVNNLLLKNSEIIKPPTEGQLYDVYIVNKIALIDLPPDAMGRPMDAYCELSYKGETKKTDHYNRYEKQYVSKWFPNYVYFNLADEPHESMEFKVFDNFYHSTKVTHFFSARYPIGGFRIPITEELVRSIKTDEPSEQRKRKISGLINMDGAGEILCRKAGVVPRFEVDFVYTQWSVNYSTSNRKSRMGFFNWVFWTGVMGVKSIPMRGVDVPQPIMKKPDPELKWATPGKIIPIKVCITDLTTPPFDVMTLGFSNFVCQLPYEAFDDGDVWSSRKQGVETLGEYFGSYIPESIEGEWTDKGEDLTSDNVLHRYFFYGIGGSTLVGERDNTGKITGFSSSFEILKQFPVRAGYLPYEGQINFDEEGKVRNIVYRGETMTKEHPFWEKAKFILRTSAITFVTAKDHLVQGHFIWSNFTTWASTSCLGPNHPIRRLLHIHTYRTALVNHSAALLLTPKGGALSRNLSFPYETLMTIIETLFKGFEIRLYPDLLKKNNLDGVDHKVYPVGTDGEDLWNIINNYVRDYFGVFYNDTDKKIEDDEELVAFWKKFIEIMPPGCFTRANVRDFSEYKIDNIVDVLTEFIHYVSGQHTQVGNAAAYGRDPAFAGNSIGERSLMTYPQNQFLQTMVVVVTAGLMPLMTEDTSHLLPKASHDVYHKYRNELIALSNTIQDRNKEREWTYNSYCPSMIQTGVSV